MDEKTIVCCKCNCELAPREITFQYMGHHINHMLLACPSCGQVFITEELVNGKVQEVEMLLEEK